MSSIVYLNRDTGKKEVEKVYGAQALKLLYGDSWLSKTLGVAFLQLLSRFSFFSAAFGFWQKLPFTKKKIARFIKDFEVDASEFASPPESFQSFNDFFIRKLKKEARPIAEGKKRAVIPADARYWFYQDIEDSKFFKVKGEAFNLASLLSDKQEAEKYAHGSLIIARLCPSDYHRFHFPCDCIPGKTRLINGFLFSVNPIALQKDLTIFTKNKRTVCTLKSEEFGKVAYLEIGATTVGSIHETYEPGIYYPKGTEKGFFSFGGSSLILLFEKGRIQLDQDLVQATKEGYEIKCLMGQSMGVSL